VDEVNAIKRYAAKIKDCAQAGDEQLWHNLDVVADSITEPVPENRGGANRDAEGQGAVAAAVQPMLLPDRRASDAWVPLLHCAGSAAGFAILPGAYASVPCRTGHRGISGEPSRICTPSIPMMHSGE
jgi:hypothetical protein